MKTKIIILALILCGSMARAEDFTTLDGDKYTNCTIKRVEPDGIVVADNDGVRKLKFKNLPAEIGQKYNYDPAKAEAFKAAQIQSEADRVAQIVKIQTAQIAAATATPIPQSATIQKTSSKQKAPPTDFEMKTLLSGRHHEKYKTETMYVVSRDKDGLNVRGDNGSMQFIRANDLPYDIQQAYGFSQ